jgi:hypothetical protein
MIEQVHCPVCKNAFDPKGHALLIPCDMSDVEAKPIQAFGMTAQLSGIQLHAVNCPKCGVIFVK